MHVPMPEVYGTSSDWAMIVCGDILRFLVISMKHGRTFASTTYVALVGLSYIVACVVNIKRALFCSVRCSHMPLEWWYRVGNNWDAAFKLGSERDPKEDSSWCGVSSECSGEEVEWEEGLTSTTVTTLTWTI
jgi:hypothetical protein